MARVASGWCGHWRSRRMRIGSSSIATSTWTICANTKRRRCAVRPDPRPVQPSTVLALSRTAATECEVLRASKPQSTDGLEPRIRQRNGARKSALVTNIGFKPQPKAQTPILPSTGIGVGLEYSPALRPERLPVVPKRDLVEPPGYRPGVPPLGGTLMPKLSYLHLSAAVLAFAGLVGADARSAEIEGALQYPPPSVGEDAQPPPPARTVPPPMLPLRAASVGDRCTAFR
jgi:hypothetical protein